MSTSNGQQAGTAQGTDAMNPRHCKRTNNSWAYYSPNYNSPHGHFTTVANEAVRSKVACYTPTSSPSFDRLLRGSSKRAKNYLGATVTNKND